MGVAVVTAGAYLIISPIAREKMSVEDPAVIAATSMPTGEDREEYEPAYEERGESIEKEEREGAEAPDSADDSSEATPEPARTSAPAPSTATVPVTTTKPTVTATPEPAPTKPSGYTLAQVAEHATKESCWTTINGSVYDITSYIPRHPGGERNIMKVCGKDGTSLFEGQHGGDSKPESRLASFRIGALNE